MGDLYGKYVKMPVAYCILHKCFLSVKQMRGKECVQKGCWHMRKQDHPYWGLVEERKVARKARKIRLGI